MSWRLLYLSTQKSITAAIIASVGKDYVQEFIKELRDIVSREAIDRLWGNIRFLLVTRYLFTLVVGPYNAALAPHEYNSGIQLIFSIRAIFSPNKTDIRHHDEVSSEQVVCIISLLWISRHSCTLRDLKYVLWRVKSHIQVTKKYSVCAEKIWQ